MKNKIKLKKGYKVIVVAGKDKGKTGEILKIFPVENKALVAGVNVVKKHTKPSKSGAGGIVEKNMPIHISNISYLDPKENKPSKVGFKILDGGDKKRFIKKSGEIIG